MNDQRAREDRRDGDSESQDPAVDSSSGGAGAASGGDHVPAEAADGEARDGDSAAAPEGAGHTEEDGPADADSAGAQATDEAPPDRPEESGGDGGGADTPGGSDPQAPPPPPRRGGRWLVALALLVALAAGGLAGWLGWRLQQLERRVAAIPAERANALEPLAEYADLRELESRFGERLESTVEERADALAAARDEALGDIRERMATLEAGVVDIQELATRDQIGWRLAEIRYLLAIGQRRVLIDRDTRSAIVALEAADRAIAELGNVRLLPLRERIVDDLAALRAVQPADIEGIALRLQNLVGRVPELRSPSTGETAEAASAEAAGDGWWDQLRARLDGVVSVRRLEAGPARGRPEPATGLPQADRLVLALERARDAALSRDPVAYGRALERAAGILDDGFADGDQTTERFEDSLAELSERPVAVELPDLEPTLTLAERLSARIEAERARSREEDPAGQESPTGRDGDADPGAAGANGGGED